MSMLLTLALIFDATAETLFCRALCGRGFHEFKPPGPSYGGMGKFSKKISPLRDMSLEASRGGKDGAGITDSKIFGIENSWCGDLGNLVCRSVMSFVGRVAPYAVRWMHTGRKEYLVVTGSSFSLEEGGLCSMKRTLKWHYA